MRAKAAIAVDADATGRTRIVLLRSAAPLVLRPTPDAVYIAAGAAGPLGGDDLALRVEVGAGARLTLRTVAATVVLPGAGESVLALELRVAPAGRLEVLPEPTVVAAGACHRMIVDGSVAAGGALILREEVSLGRYGETGGRYRGLTSIDLAGRPLLRHEFVLDGSEAGEAGSATGARAIGSLLTVDPAWADPSVRPAGWAHPDAAAMPLAGPGLLVTALAADTHTLRRRLGGPPTAATTGTL